MNASIAVLWDASHIWGLTVRRALVHMGLPHRLVKAASIAQGALSGKPPALLIAPGGSARLKSKALGPEGRTAVRDFVSDGGHYLGICGGAGFALSEPGGLSLCPWRRASYSNRLQHLISGHILVKMRGNHPLCPEWADALPLPVWWPGRFAPQPDDDVRILGSYLQPAGDIWLADLPLDSLPPDTLSDWESMYGVRFRPEELYGQACMVHAPFGAGSYTLSYSHLETPDSPPANRLFAHMLRELTGIAPASEQCPDWGLADRPVNWDDEVLNRARAILEQLIRTGVEHRLIFSRTSWLWGWRTGIPGAALNNMCAALYTAQDLTPNDDALAWWRDKKALFDQKMELFRRGVEQYLLAERLAATLAAAQPQAIDRRVLNLQREALFGPAMEGGGLYEDLTGVLEELVFLICEDGSVFQE